MEHSWMKVGRKRKKKKHTLMKGERGEVGTSRRKVQMTRGRNDCFCEESFMRKFRNTASLFSPRLICI